MTAATLALEDGTILTGQPFGASADAVFELVFNTSMTGYQEILSDPSYHGQGVLFTTSHVGNVGINLEDQESAVPQASAAVVREISGVVSNWRAALPLPDWLAQHGVPGISGVDTRYLTRKLRDQGTLKAALSTRGTSGAELLAMARAWPGLDGRDMVQEVSSGEFAPWPGDPGDRWLERAQPGGQAQPGGKAQPSEQAQPGGKAQPSEQAQLRGEAPQIVAAPHIIVMDYGAKRNILRHLAAFGARVSVAPAYASCAEVMALRPDGILLSNGPGDPAGLPRIVATVSELLSTGVPIFGICLGHQLIGRALGGQTIKLKFGHHSGNHPVQDLRSGKVQVTSQNHNYAVAIDSLDPAQVEITHLSLNDRTLEGMRLKDRPVFSVQYHPEAAPGPHDAHGLFAEFFQMIHSAHLTCADYR